MFKADFLKKLLTEWLQSLLSTFFTSFLDIVLRNRNAVAPDIFHLEVHVCQYVNQDNLVKLCTF